MIIRQDDFTWHAASPNRCFALGRPKLKGEAGVFLLGVADTEENEVRGVKGQVQISEGAVREMAIMLDWHAPEAIARWRKLHERAVHALEERIAYLEGEIEQADPSNPTIRQLARALDLAEAKADDAIKQFQAADAELKKLRSTAKGVE